MYDLYDPVTIDPDRFLRVFDTYMWYEGLFIANPTFIQIVIYCTICTIAVVGNMLYRLGRKHGRQDRHSS